MAERQYLVRTWSRRLSLTRATIQLGDVTFDKISDPTPAQRRAFDLIGVPIPLTLTLK